MGKKEKKKKLGIKTSRYYTKQCGKCGYEYPSWFTHCPMCNIAWDESKDIQKLDKDVTKTIKILVKITEEEFNENINNTLLIFSGDQGKSWFQTNMESKMDYFIAEIPEVPIGSVIIYYIEVHLISGEKFIENNNGKYFYYKVGAPIEDSEEEPPESETQVIKDNITKSSSIPQKYDESSKLIKQNQIDYEPKFKKPQNNIDFDLKVCPHCNSKIKKTWTTCPICGNKL